MRDIELQKRCEFRGYTETKCVIYNSYETVIIDKEKANLIVTYLQNRGNLVVRSYNSNITIDARLEWHTDNKLTFITRESIILTPESLIETSGIVELKSGIEGENDKATVVFEGQQNKISLVNTGQLEIYYNPIKGEEYEASTFTISHKYYNLANPENYSSRIKGDRYILYRLINTPQDLRDVEYSMTSSYALSKDLIYKNVQEAGCYGRITPPPARGGKIPEAIGIFNGNNFKLKDFKILHPDWFHVALFDKCDATTKIMNFIIEDFSVEGKMMVGLLCGRSIGATFENITVRNCYVKGRDFVGGLVGYAKASKFNDIRIDVKIDAYGEDADKGDIVGDSVGNEFKNIIIGKTADIAGIDGRDDDEL